MTLFYLLLLLAASATFSGAETGFYSLSRVHVAAEARRGRFIARLIERLIQNPAGFLITLLVGNNLTMELMAHLAGGQVSTWAFLPPWSVEIVATLLLTPVVFLFGELFPKDLFRRRPRGLYAVFAPPLALARLVFLPVVAPLALLSAGLERLFGVRAREFEREIARERVQEILSEGARAGVLSPRAQTLAQNVYHFRTRTAADVMVPWAAVETCSAADDPEATRARVAAAAFSRLPVVEHAKGRIAVRTYLHQLDLLADACGAGAPRPPAELVRPLPALAPDATVDRALARLRGAGQRMALVGTPEAPLGIVTLKDLVQTISGELGGW
jgi:CBS domain containing-hemolysin-like protein